MTRRAVVAIAALVLATSAGVAHAQIRTVVRAQPVFETYDFDPGLTYAKVAEFALPVGIDVSLGSRVNVTLSSGFVRLDLSPDSAFAAVSGLMDTEARVGFNILPGRLIMVLRGSLPTGTKVDSAQAAVLTPIASDVIGFAIPTLGSGGSVGGGFVGAIPVGRYAVGLGATYSYGFTYEPFDDKPDLDLVPGSEFRARLGLEGPLARTTYLRVAGVFASRAKDEFGGFKQPGIGQRYIGYGEVVQGLGRMQLTLYAFDVYRGRPIAEAGATGVAILPKGNLIAAGFRHTIPVGRSFSVAPRAEWRMSTIADTAPGSPLKKAGSSIRVGMDVRHTFTAGMSLAVYGSGLFGNIRPPLGADIPLSGWRTGLMFSVAR